MERTGFVIYAEQDAWLDTVTRKYGVGDKFIARRAVNYYRNVVWGDGADTEFVQSATSGYSGYVKSGSSERKYVKLPSEDLQWIRDKADEYGVAMSFVFRRALDKYKNEVIQGSWNDPQLEELT